MSAPIASGGPESRSSPYQIPALPVSSPYPIPPSAPNPGAVHAPAVAESSASMPAVRRPWALIAVVLLIDLGLAAAGTWLLTEGLATSSTGRAPRSGASVSR